MNDVKAFETHFSAPLAEIRARIIECIAELDEHVQRHEKSKNILTSCVVNQSFDCNECTAWRQSLVSQTDEVHFLLEIPIVKNHAHRDQVSLGQWVLEEIARGSADSVTETGSRNVLLRDRFDGRQIEGNALTVRMLLCTFDTEQAGCATYVAQSLISRKVELRREGFEVNPGKPGHCAHELCEPVSRRLPSLVNTSNSTAVRRTLEDQKAKAV